MKKRIEPKLGKNIKESSCFDINQDNFVDMFIHNKKLIHDLEELEINGCYFKNVDFSDIQVRNCEFIDCIFENCNLMGCDFSSKSIHRVCFRHCNLGSTNYIMSSIKDVLFDDCKCDYINFSDSKIDTLEIQDSLFREARFINIKLKNVAFNKVNFHGCEFLNTSLKNVDFSSCDISFAVIPPNIFPFSPAFTFKSNVILFIFSACFLNSSISKLFLCACESFFACSFRRLSFVASNANFFGNKKFLA